MLVGSYPAAGPTFINDDALLVAPKVHQGLGHPVVVIGRSSIRQRFIIRDALEFEQDSFALSISVSEHAAVHALDRPGTDIIFAQDLFQTHMQIDFGLLGFPETDLQVVIGLNAAEHFLSELSRALPEPAHIQESGGIEQSGFDLSMR